MSYQILLVDDERCILDAYRRVLQPKFQVSLANSGQEGLALIQKNGPFAVVVSDMHMPEMDGIQFLSQVKELSPDSTRMMLTGGGDQIAVQAVNEGNVFRFLAKPCADELLELALESGIAQYRLVTAERAMFSSTLTGAVKILTDTLAMVRPVAFGRTSRVRSLVRSIGTELIPNNMWRVELSAMLSQIGCLTVSETTLAKAFAGKWLPGPEAKLVEGHPRSGHTLVANVPRLQEIAEIILQQNKSYDGSGFPFDDKGGNDIPIEARILKVALDFDTLTNSGLSRSKALTEMRGRKGTYDPQVLDVVVKQVTAEAVENVLAAHR